MTGMPWDQNVLYQTSLRRGNFVNALVDLWRTVADRRYHVIRGFVAWDAWDFKKQPYAVALQMSQVQFASTKFPGLLLTMEIMNAQKYELTKDQDITENFAETGLDRMYFDASWVLNGLCEKVDDNGSSVVQNIKYDEIVGREIHDPATTVQGLVVQAPIIY